MWKLFGSCVEAVWKLYGSCVEAVCVELFFLFFSVSFWWLSHRGSFFANISFCLVIGAGASVEARVENDMSEVDLSNLDPAFDGVLRPGVGRCEYFQDRNRRWPFHCDDEGYRLLARLLRAATPVVATVQAKIELACDVANDPNGRAAADAVVAEGQQIYARKPNMGEHDVTWSQREYGHLGLQKEYVRYKSVQRLTEAWACLQRAKRAGLFFELDETPLAEGETPSVPLRWASLGGGPGFELVAVRWFFEKHFPKYKLDLVSLDLETSWREAAEGLGLRFNAWDITDGEGLENAAGGPVDYAVCSYVLKMYMTNETCARWLGRKLNAPSVQNALRAVLVVSRDENLEPASRLMRDPAIGSATVVPLMEPGFGRDDRQIAFAPGGWTPPVGSSSSGPLTFPNVPYEEHKKRRQGGHGGRGGGRGGGQGGGVQTRDGGFRDGGFRGANGGGWSDYRRDRDRDRDRDRNRGERRKDTGRW